MYALGWTHHSQSVQLIQATAMLQLLLGNLWRPGGGVNALRAHANYVTPQIISLVRRKIHAGTREPLTTGPSLGPD